MSKVFGSGGRTGVGGAAAAAGGAGADAGGGGGAATGAGGGAGLAAGGGAAAGGGGGGAGFTAAGGVGPGVGWGAGGVADTVGLTAGCGGAGVEGVGVVEVASTFGGVVVSALASAGCDARAGCEGCGSGSFAYFANSARALARSLPPSTLCSFMSFSQASTTGSVALRQRATASGNSVVIGSPRPETMSTTAAACTSHMAPAILAAGWPELLSMTVFSSRGSLS